MTITILYNHFIKFLSYYKFNYIKLINMWGIYHTQKKKKKRNKNFQHSFILMLRISQITFIVTSFINILQKIYNDYSIFLLFFFLTAKTSPLFIHSSWRGAEDCIICSIRNFPLALRAPGLTRILVSLTWDNRYFEAIHYSCPFHHNDHLLWNFH